MKIHRSCCCSLGEPRKTLPKGTILYFKGFLGGSLANGGGGVGSFREIISLRSLREKEDKHLETWGACQSFIRRNWQGLPLKCFLMLRHTILVVAMTVVVVVDVIFCHSLSFVTTKTLEGE